MRFVAALVAAGVLLDAACAVLAVLDAFHACGAIDDGGFRVARVDSQLLHDGEDVLHENRLRSVQRSAFSVLDCCVGRWGLDIKTCWCRIARTPSRRSSKMRWIGITESSQRGSAGFPSRWCRKLKRSCLRFAWKRCDAMTRTECSACFCAKKWCNGWRHWCRTPRWREMEWEKYGEKLSRSWSPIWKRSRTSISRGCL